MTRHPWLSAAKAAKREPAAEVLAKRHQVGGDAHDFLTATWRQTGRHHLIKDERTACFVTGGSNGLQVRCGRKLL